MIGASSGLPRWFLPALALGIAAGQLGRFPVASFGLKEVPLLLADLAVGLAVLWGVLSWTRRRELRIDAITGRGLLFALVGAGSALASADHYGLSSVELATSLAYLARWLAAFLLYAVVRDHARGADVEPAWRTLEGAALFLAGFGVLQAAFLPNFAQILHPDAELYTQWDPQGHRLVSTFLDPNLLGGFLVLVLLQQLGRIALGAHQPLAGVGLVVLALLLTVSRGSFLALGVGITTLAVVLRGIPRRAALAASLVGGVLLPTLPAVVGIAWATNKFSLADPSLLLRFVAWGQAWEVFREHPWFGIGFNTYGFVQREVYGFAEFSASAFGLDGGILFLAVLTGGVGAALYLGMLGSALSRLAARVHHARPDPAPSPVSVRAPATPEPPAGQRGIALGVAAGIPALLVHALFTNSLLYAFIQVTLWISLGLALADPDPRPAPPPPPPPPRPTP